MYTSYTYFRGWCRILELDKDTTVRLKQSTKERLHSLNFVRKHSDDEIINCLIDIFKDSSKKDENTTRRIIEIRRARTQELKRKLRSIETR